MTFELQQLVSIPGREKERHGVGKGSASLFRRFSGSPSHNFGFHWPFLAAREAGKHVILSRHTDFWKKIRVLQPRKKGRKDTGQAIPLAILLSP